MKLSKRLIKGYTGVVESSNTISDEDVAVIGWQTTVKLFRVREQRTGAGGKQRDHALKDAIKDELSGILAEEKVYNTDSDHQSESSDEDSHHYSRTPLNPYPFGGQPGLWGPEALSSVGLTCRKCQRFTPSYPD